MALGTFGFGFQGGGGVPVAETWAQTLAAGASSGGTSPIISSGDTLLFDSGGNQGSLTVSALTGNQTYTLPDATGTILLEGSEVNIYNSDGTITGARVVTSNSTISFETAGGGNFVRMNVSNGSLTGDGSAAICTFDKYQARVGASNGYRWNGFIDHKIYITGAGNMFFQVDGNDLVRYQNDGAVFRGVSINTGGAIPTATLDVQGVDDLNTSLIFRLRNQTGTNIVRTWADGDIQIGEGGGGGIATTVGIRANANTGNLAVLRVNQNGLSSARAGIVVTADTGATALQAYAINGTAGEFRKTGTASYDATVVINRITGNVTTRFGSMMLRANTPADNTQNQDMVEIAWKSDAAGTAGNQNGQLQIRHAVAGVMTTAYQLTGVSLKASIGYDYETLGSSNGYVVEDRTNGNRYRIYTDGGVVYSELVP